MHRAMGSARTIARLRTCTCSTCGAEQRVPACFGGWRGRCPACRSVVRVPSGREPEPRDLPSGGASPIRAGLGLGRWWALVGAAWVLLATMVGVFLAEVLR